MQKMNTASRPGERSAMFMHGGMEESGLTQHAIASLAEGIREMMHMHE